MNFKKIATIMLAGSLFLNLNVPVLAQKSLETSQGNTNARKSKKQKLKKNNSFQAEFDKQVKYIYDRFPQNNPQSWQNRIKFCVENKHKARRKKVGLFWKEVEQYFRRMSQKN